MWNPDSSAAENTYYSVAEVRAIDRAAIEGQGIPGYVLMTRAAEAALSIMREQYSDRQTWMVLCGGGNNGGDGYVLARLARAAGIGVTTCWLSDPAGLTGDAGKAYADFIAEGMVAKPFEASELPAEGLIVDAMLGSGLERDVAGSYRDAVEWANRSLVPTVALDIPTGLNGDSGRVMGVAVRADLTVTFVGLKAGLILSDGPDCCGIVVLADLDIPSVCREAKPGLLRTLPDTEFRAMLRPRAENTHKGIFGHAVIVGGAPGMSGAVRIAGEAALRAGAGMVTLLTSPEHAASLNQGRPELMVRGIESADDAVPWLAKADVVAIGPGLGLDDRARSLLAASLESAKPLIIDADALTLLAESGAVPAEAILTPHPGEAARLLGSSSAEVQADRPGALRQLAERYRATVILKGSGTLISSMQGIPWVCDEGNPGMASAGMGDALTGVVASLRGQGLEQEAAAVVGTLVHARAGDRAAQQGERGLLASDLIDAIRPLVNP